MNRKSEPEIERLGSFLATLNQESDRGSALVTASILDELIKEILQAFLVQSRTSKELLDGFNAPLGSFSARVAAAYALGLIEKHEFEEINLVRKIRNEFGHSWSSISFETPPVCDYASQLPWLGPLEHETGASHRSRFNFAIAILLTDLLWRRRLVEQEKRQPRQWPNKSRSGQSWGDLGAPRSIAEDPPPPNQGPVLLFGQTRILQPTDD